jgi:hypothetical protein
MADIERTGSDRMEAAVDLHINIIRDCFVEYQGTRALLEEEGIIPQGTQWPERYESVSWESGLFLFSLKRTRPPGARGARKLWEAVDWWALCCFLVAPPMNCFDLAIKRKAEELAEAIYRNSEHGHAEWKEHWRRWSLAMNDQAFQDFPCPWLVSWSVIQAHQI